jgi:hypothetical protein
VANDVIDPADLIGERVCSVVVGWHVHAADRSARRLFLSLSVSGDIEAHTDGSGSLRLLRRPVPNDFSMDEYGRFEFRAIDADHPAARLLDQIITTMERIRWSNTVIGLRLGSDNGVVVLANEADEVFVSDGPLPPDYDDATID